MTDQFATRSFVLDDFAIRSDGEGRTVQAYAAVFDTPAEIRDAEGHYTELLARGSFAQSIAEHASGTRPLTVLFNHARTIDGTPDGTLSVPVGVPVVVREDSTGVYTETRYLNNPLADSVLDAIKQQAIRGQSFSGRFLTTKRVPSRTRGGLPTFTRTEVAMREYGPAVFPAYVAAKIVGTRSVQSWLDHMAELDPADLAALASALGQ